MRKIIYQTDSTHFLMVFSINLNIRIIIWRVASGHQILSHNSLFLDSGFASCGRICKFLDFDKYVIFNEVQPKTLTLHLITFLLRIPEFDSI